ncbi:hypothetical protein GCU67_05365 [Modestobacter muralis]|uniref:Uncharacterized protein n=1 Tax=Modestobacter muralis TaxID=1608614 RepID=A0A6P0ERV7_9ACTN|nr:hypothetical protein [Modestobacter muralis]NEK93605.1 hypothetical protein [Modestobacter muralis]NEN50372.1 hypothetical protein [Modestobacter muralis]
MDRPTPPTGPDTWRSARGGPVGAQQGQQRPLARPVQPGGVQAVLEGGLDPLPGPQAGLGERERPDPPVGGVKMAVA